MDQSAISVLNCTFSGNSASLLGGALYRSSTTRSSDVRGCSFLKNSAGQFGGAIYEQMIDSGSIEVCRRTLTQLVGNGYAADVLRGGKQSNSLVLWEQSEKDV